LYKSRLPEYVAVRDIVVQPKTNDLVLATHGRGVFIIDDISPLRRLSTEVLEKGAALLPTRPAVVSSGHYGNAFPNTDSYAGMNAPEIATIQYYLKDRMNTGDVTVEVLDASGKVIASMPGTKRKGINFVRWDMRLAPPKAAKGVLVQGEFGVYAGFIGRLALPGTYTIRLKAGDWIDEGSLQLLPDPLMPDLDYAKKRSISDGLFQMVEELGLLEAQVRSLKDSVDQRLNLAKDKKLKDELTKLSGNLDAFRKTITETIESRGITGEQQLRARLGRLYVYTEASDNMPTQSILDGQKTIGEELKQAQVKADGYFKNDLAALNKSLAKAKLPLLNVLTKSEWEKQNSGASAAPPRPFWEIKEELQKMMRKG
ncbi:MAG: hypothetical protein JNN28_00100, partial [Saprospiraceae bacterium]|nr:hypothetical protein [Saprospiraceae bacterium]